MKLMLRSSRVFQPTSRREVSEQEIRDFRLRLVAFADEFYQLVKRHELASGYHVRVNINTAVRAGDSVAGRFTAETDFPSQVIVVCQSWIAAEWINGEKTSQLMIDPSKSNLV